MSNIFKDSAAPYVLVLLISFVGWMFNSAIDNVKNLRIIEYRTESGKDGDVDTVTIFLSNRSLTGALNAGEFSVTCRPASEKTTLDTGCLRVMPSVNAMAQFIKSGNVVLASNPTVVSKDSFLFPARIPPRGEVAFRVGVSNANVVFRPVYEISDRDLSTNAGLSQILIVDRSSLSICRPIEAMNKLLIFTITNYLMILLASLIVSVLLMLVWIARQFLRGAFTEPKEEKLSGTFKITIHGDSYEATIEET